MWQERFSQGGQAYEIYFQRLAKDLNRQGFDWVFHSRRKVNSSVIDQYVKFETFRC